jgi:hypothetical protein
MNATAQPLSAGPKDFFLWECQDFTHQDVVISRSTVGCDPEHKCHPIAQFFALPAVDMHISPGVINRGDGEACDITSNQVKHVEASQRWAQLGTGK